ncbi:MAG: hypothetical protein AAGF77_00130 [Bacteroidota bacterium]
MPGPIVHLGATVTCAHGGTAVPASTSTRVFVQGQPIALQPIPYNIAGCPFTVPPGSPMPCVTGMWTTGSKRVFSTGMPVVLFDSQSTSVPNGTPMFITKTQMRVIGS